MIAIGTIRAILSADYVLVETEEYVTPGEELIVFVALEDELIEEAVGLSEIHIPKGRLVVSAHQQENIYLASTRTAELIKTTEQQNIFASGLEQALGFREVIKSVPKKLHATVNPDENLKLNISEAVSVGDKIAKADGM